MPGAFVFYHAPFSNFELAQKMQDQSVAATEVNAAVGQQN
jgi:hypothetical protein